MNTISFVTANYVARQLNYEMPGGWGQGDRATNAYFEPIGSFGQRFDEMLHDIKALGFEAIDLWSSHLNPQWATADHVRIASDLLRKHNLTVISLAGWFGSTADEFEATCKVANAVGARILGGSTGLLGRDREAAIHLLNKYDLLLGLENHPEKTPDELLSKIGDGGGGRVGAAVDTGWFGTQGFNAAEALDHLRDHLLLVHLKDVLASGAHDTCRYGQGVVPIEACVRTLQRIGYNGNISVEHEPEHSDPTDDCRANLQMLRTWLAA